MWARFHAYRQSFGTRPAEFGERFYGGEMNDVQTKVEFPAK
jgi:hypothetical protein